MLRRLGCVLAAVVVVVGVATVIMLIAGIPLADFSSTELSITFAALVTSGAFAGAFFQVGGSTADVRIKAVVERMGLKTAGSRVSGSLGGVAIEADEVLFETADRKQTPCWMVNVPSASSWPLAVLSVDGALSQQALDLPPMDVSASLGPRFALHASAGPPTWMSPEIVARLAPLEDVVQLRSSPEGFRLLVRRPLRDPLTLRRALLFVRSFASPPFDEASLAPAVTPPEAHGKKKRVGRNYVARGAALAGFLLPLSVFGAIAPDCEGHEPAILERVNACSLARDALGTPIERRLFGLQLSRKDNRSQSSEVLVRGPRGEGHVTVHFYAQTTGTAWQDYRLRRAVLETGSGRVIEVLTCTEGARLGLSAPRRWQGLVRAHRGGVPVPDGTACAITASPTPGSYPCRLVVRCAEHVLFGATANRGFAHCAEIGHDGGTSIVARDEDRRRPRSEPSLVLDEHEGVARLTAVGRDWWLDIALGAAPAQR